MEDGRAAVAWLRDRVAAHQRILVWGHRWRRARHTNIRGITTCNSLGGAVATRVLAQEFSQLGQACRVEGLMLEATFNNFTDQFLHITSNPLEFPPAKLQMLHTAASVLIKTSRQRDES